MIVLNVPFALYDYIAVFIPGILIILGVSASGVFPIKATGNSSIVEIVVYLCVAFGAGHLNQWIAKQSLAALGEFWPVLGYMPKYLLDTPYKGCTTNQPGIPRRALNAALALSPHPSVLLLSEQNVKLIKERATAASGRSCLTTGEIHGVCLSVLQASKSPALTKRDLLIAQADFHRGSYSALLVVALTVWKWGLPPTVSTMQVYGQDRLWVVLALVFFSFAMLKRYLARSRDAASLVFSAFLAVSKNEDKVDKPGLIVL